MDWGKDIPQHSLTVLNKETYLATYSRLKVTYANQLKQVWTEKTDPDKFIHEDLGIASYLITLWQEDRWNQAEKPNFVDMGCGNGLLTYLLTCEGYSGYGFDVRDRKIWKCFEPKPNLMVRPFHPADKQLFETCDKNTWLIGNHPDELTPWIPVLARCLMCQFFIIPCCAYDFTGKFKREKGGYEGTSVYSTYVQFIRRLCESCGFSITFDRMRIPSTKRTCIIGKLNEDLHKDPTRNQETLTFCQDKINESDSQDGVFKPRPASEPVRNCTKINPSVITDSVKILFEYLLSNSSIDKGWNSGKQDLLIKDAVKIMPPEHLKQMKAQHGGFQTLVKNHGHIFQVVEGCIRLRVPSDKDAKGVRYQQRPKTRRCYFFDNHPQKCPLSSEDCRFIH